MNITPTPSARAQILDVVRASPGITSGAISKQLPHVEIRHICAHLAILAGKGRLTRIKQANAWCYTAPADATAEVDDDEPDSPPAPASRITTHVAQAPRRPGRITAAEAASRAESEHDEPTIETAAPADDDRAGDLGEPVAAASSSDDDALRLTPTFPQGAIVTDELLGDPGSTEPWQPPSFSLDSHGALSIPMPAGALHLSPERTRKLGEFLMFTSAVWSRP